MMYSKALQLSPVLLSSPEGNSVVQHYSFALRRKKDQLMMTGFILEAKLATIGSIACDYLIAVATILVMTVVVWPIIY